MNELTSAIFSVVRTNYIPSRGIKIESTVRLAGFTSSFFTQIQSTVNFIAVLIADKFLLDRNRNRMSCLT